MSDRKPYEPYKYRLHELLRKLTVEEYEVAWKYFPTRLQISRETLRTWIYIKQSDKREIPARALVCFGRFFGIEPDQVYNQVEDFQHRTVVSGTIA